GELRSLTGYIAAKMAIGGAFAVRPNAQLKAAIASARKAALARCDSPPCSPPEDLAPEQVLEVKIGSFGKGCAITANLVDLASLTAVAAATERFDCDDALEEALDRTLGRLVNDEPVEDKPTAGKKSEAASDRLRLDLLSSINERLKELKALDAEAATRL